MLLGRRRFTGLALPLVAPLALVACSASPNPNYYSVAVRSGPTFPAGPKIVLLKDIGLASYLDRREIVRSSEGYRLDVMSNDWWGEPLGPMLSRILIEELSQRLPQSTIFNESGAVTASPDATIELNFQRLDEDAAGNLVLQAQASTSFKGRPGQTLRNFRFVVTPPTGDTQGEVTAVSTAVGQLADGIASMLVTGR
jgi:uncharacterized lipoprotein YmbA